MVQCQLHHSNYQKDPAVAMRSIQLLVLFLVYQKAFLVSERLQDLEYG